MRLVGMRTGCGCRLADQGVKLVVVIGRVVPAERSAGMTVARIVVRRPVMMTVMMHMAVRGHLCRHGGVDSQRGRTVRQNDDERRDDHRERCRQHDEAAH